MLWKLRLLWYRTDKAALAFALFFGLVVGLLAFALGAVFAQRARVHDFHARSLDCLARNVYYEARGESSAGQYAVAEVTMNRKASTPSPRPRARRGSARSRSPKTCTTSGGRRRCRARCTSTPSTSGQTGQRKGSA